MAEEHLTGTVTAQQKWREHLFSMQVTVPQPLKFVAGQFTKIGLPAEGGKPLMRPYSFVNAPEEQPHEFLYDVLTEQGNLTPLLAKLEPGDPVLVSARPNGLLVLNELPAAKHLFLVATGTGVGPFLSILKTDEPWQRFAKIVLSYSVRTEDYLIYRGIIDALQAKHPQQLRFLPTVTREQVVGCARQRITEQLGSGQLEEAAGLSIGSDCQFLLCGNPDMVKDLSAALAERGLLRNRRARPGNVTIEKYW